MTPALVGPATTRPEGQHGGRLFTRVGHLRRYREIVSILVKYGFVDVVDALHLRPYLVAGRRVLSALGRESRSSPQFISRIDCS